MKRPIWIYLFFICLVSSSCLKVDDPTPDLPSLLARLQERSQYSTFLAAIERTDLQNQLDGGIIATIFVPTNLAFAEYFAANGYADINAIPLDSLNLLVSYHIQLGSAAISQIIPNYYTSPSRSGADSTNLSLLIDVVGNSMVLNNYAEVSMPDLQANNGYLHGIDKVLLFPKTLDLLTGRNEMFLEAIEAADLTDLLNEEGPYTIFVPTDDAFTSYFQTTEGVDSLQDWTPDRIGEIFRYHIVAGNRQSTSFNGGDVNTLNRTETLIVNSFDNSLVINITASSLLVNIQGTNGVMHFIDKLLIPN